MTIINEEHHECTMQCRGKGVQRNTIDKVGHTNKNTIWQDKCENNINLDFARMCWMILIFI